MDHREVLCLFHDCIINRDIFNGGPCFSFEAIKPTIIFARLYRFSQLSHQIRFMAFKSGKNILGFEKEHTCIPQERARIAHILSARGIRFLDETYWLDGAVFHRLGYF